MNIVARGMLLGWPLLCLGFFLCCAPRRAILLSLFCGWLFLPVARLEFPGVPDYGRAHAIAVGALLGAVIFDSHRLLQFDLRWFDLPIAGWCLSAGAASLANSLGWYDAASVTLQRCATWGVFYFLGRVYFADLDGLTALAHSLFYAGLAYAPLCLLEMRLSPQLHTWVYGFHQHSFGQSSRGDSWRPVVFMEHGLAVGLWMILAALAGLWLWKSKRLPPSILGLPTGAVVAGLVAVAVLCRSSGATVLLAAGAAVFALRRSWAPALVGLLLVLPFAYILLRASSLWSGQNLVEAVAEVSPARAESLDYRMRAENLLVEHALRQPWLGWGGYGRNRPVTFDVNAVPMATDGFWIIAFGQCGVLGLGSALALLLLGPAVLWFRLPPAGWGAPRLAPVAFSASLLALYTIDCLFNAMMSPVYTVFAGGFTAAACARAPRPAPTAAAAGASP
ncbi:MAG TPA: O-antigen ligase domain-containing protein [Planctomycetota bacterium]